MATKHRSPDGVWRRCQAGAEKCKFSRDADGAARHVDASLSDEEAELQYRKDTGKDDSTSSLRKSTKGKKSLNEMELGNLHDSFNSDQSTIHDLNQRIVSKSKDLEKLSESEGRRLEYDEEMRQFQNIQTALRNTTKHAAEVREQLEGTKDEPMYDPSHEDVEEYRKTVARMQEAASKAYDYNERRELDAQLSQYRYRNSHLEQAAAKEDAEAVLSKPVAQYHGPDTRWHEEAVRRTETAAYDAGVALEKTTADSASRRVWSDVTERDRYKRRKDALTQYQTNANLERAMIDQGFERNISMQLDTATKDFRALDDTAFRTKSHLDLMRMMNDDPADIANIQRDYRMDMQLRSAAERRVKELRSALEDQQEQRYEEMYLEEDIEATEQHLNEVRNGAPVPDAYRVSYQLRLQHDLMGMHRRLDALSRENS